MGLMMLLGSTCRASSGAQSRELCVIYNYAVIYILALANAEYLDLKFRVLESMRLSFFVYGFLDYMEYIKIKNNQRKSQNT